jgi:hypothetical protein
MDMERIYAVEYTERCCATELVAFKKAPIPFTRFLISIMPEKELHYVVKMPTLCRSQ